jgi:hypothetical protein
MNKAEYDAYKADINAKFKAKAAEAKTAAVEKQAKYKEYINTINRNYIDRLRAEGKRTTPGYTVGGKDMGYGVTPDAQVVASTGQLPTYSKAFYGGVVIHSPLTAPATVSGATPDKGIELAPGDFRTIIGEGGVPWDWKAAIDGPQGEPLPSGAIGWLPTGRPNFGSYNLEGKGFLEKYHTTWDQFWKSTLGDMAWKARAEAKLELPPDPVSPKNVPFSQARSTPDMLALMQDIKRHWSEIELRGDVLGGASRFIGAGLENLMQLVMQPAQETEQKWGREYVPAMEALKLAESRGMELDALTKLGIGPMKPAMSFLLRGTPGSVLTDWLSLQATEAVVKGFVTPVEYNQLRDQNLESARIAYSYWLAPANTEKFRQLELEGRDPRALAMELGSPSAEFWGQSLWDPTVLAQIPLDYTFMSMRLAKNANTFARAATPAARSALNKLGVDMAPEVVARNMDELVKATGAMADMTAGRIVTTSEARGPLTLIARGKRAVYGDRMATIWTTIAGHANKDPDKFNRIILAMTDLASPNDADRLAALAALTKEGFPLNVALSPAGSETSLFMRDLFIDAEGKVNISKIAKAIAQAGDDGDKLAVFLGEMTDDVLERRFPTVGEQVKSNAKYAELQTSDPDAAAKYLARNPMAATEPPRWAKAIEPAYEKVQKWFYRPVAETQGVVYMGINPAYKFRNRWQNAGHLLVDVGPEPAFRTVLGMGPKNSYSRLKKIFGGIPEPARRGIGAAGAGMEKASGGGLERTFSRSAARDESHAAAAVMAKSAEDAMDNAMTRGRGTPMGGLDLLTPQDRELLLSAAESSRGDIDGAINAFRGGDVVPAIPKDLAKKLRELGVYDSAVERIRSANSMDEALEAIDDLLLERRRIGNTSAGEATFTDLVDNPTLANEVVEDAHILEANISSEAGDLIERKAAAAGEAKRLAGMVADDAESLARAKLLGQRARDAAAAGENAGDAVAEASKQLDSVGIKTRAAVDARTNVAVTTAKENRRILWQALDESRNKEANLHAMWKEYKLPGNPPAEITPRDFRTAVVLNYDQKQSALWAGLREQVVVEQKARAATYAMVSGEHLNQAGWDAMQEALENARAFDNATIRNGVAYVERPNGFRARRLINTIEKEGTFVFRDAAKAEGVAPEALAQLTSPEGVPFAVMGRDPETGKFVISVNQQRLAGMTDEEIIISLNHEVSHLADNFVQARTVAGDRTLLYSAQRAFPVAEVAPEVAASMTPEGLKAARVGYDLELMSDAGVAYNLDRKALRQGRSEIRPTIAAMKPAEQKRAYEFWRGLYESPDTDFAPLFDDIAKEYKSGSNIEAIVAPADGMTPSPARVVHETQKAAEEGVRDLKTLVRGSWNDLNATRRLTPAQDAAVDAWANVARTRATEAKAQALGVATDFRDFALHNYGKRYGLDLVAQLIYPYQFWYSRTYAKWMQRVAKNPWILAEYGRYRKKMEISHAGLPDWWKYSLNSNELLGLNSAEPVWFNLEALLNPINGVTGVDFTDPKKRVDNFTTTVDGLNKFGPSIWTPFGIGIAAYYHQKGMEDTASRWAGRLTPITRTIRDLTALSGWNKGMGVELDPLTGYFGDPYEDARVGRALTSLAPVYGWAAVNSAARDGKGPLWDEARAIAIHTRAPNVWSIVAPFFVGAGAKPRTKADIEIDRMYSSISLLINSKDNLSDDEYRRKWDALRETYPFMDAILISKKSGAERDEAFAWNVLSRIPPGGSRELYERAGLLPEAADAFYESKGDLTKLSEADRAKFMGGIVELASLLELPSPASRSEWNEARNRYRQVETYGEQMFGVGIWDKTDVFYDKKAIGSAEARAYVTANPDVARAMDWKQTQIMGDPVMAAYYASQESVERYYTEQYLYAPARAQFGEDIFDKIDIHSQINKVNGTAGKAYWTDHPELAAYKKLQTEANKQIDAIVASIMAGIPEGKPEVYREGVEPTAEEPSSYIQDTAEAEVARYLGGVAEEAAPAAAQAAQQMAWPQVQQVLGISLSNLVADYVLRGEPLPAPATYKLREIAAQAGMSEAAFMQLVAQAVPR